MQFVQTLSDIFNSIEDKSCILSDILWCFSYITDYEESSDDLIEYKNELVHEIIKKLNLAKVIKLLEEKESIRSPTLRIIGNLTTYENVEYADLLPENNLIKYLGICMNNNLTSVIQETCWIISNIATGPIEHIEQIIQSELITLLFSAIKDQDITVLYYIYIYIYIG